MLSATFSFKHVVKDSTYIHSHTRELPLSAEDIAAAIKLKVKKMVSITPEGKYMSIELNEKSRKKVQGELPLLFSRIYKKYDEMTAVYGENFIHKDSMHLQEYADFTLDTLKGFFEKTGLKVRTNFY